jgi:DNA-binding beta-propeller fold protein YncE
MLMPGNRCGRLVFVSCCAALLPVAATVRALSLPVSAPGVPDAVFTSYEVAQVHPLDVTPDGTKLLSVNTANGTLEVFTIEGSGLTLASVIKVGVEPITVRAASNTQAWVVNEMSDSVSIVDIRNNVLDATLQTDDEPADVVFAGSPRRAYVSVAQARELMQASSVGAGGVKGRYVRVALAGTNYLQLAEVRVMGWPVGSR